MTPDTRKAALQGGLSNPVLRLDIERENSNSLSKKQVVRWESIGDISARITARIAAQEVYNG
jgi:hypothetical protein